MNTTRLASLCVPALLLGVSGCSSDHHDTESSSVLEQEFLSSIDTTSSAAAVYATAPDQAKARNNYRQHMNRNLGHLSDLWRQMRSVCDGLDSDCPTGGGMTGNQSNQCVSGGHMMDEERMQQLHGFIDACQASLDDFWSSCGANWSSDCSRLTVQHTDRVRSILGQMSNSCSAWWSDDTMMHGQHQHWNCGSDHH